MNLRERVAHRYIRATDEEALDTMVSHWSQVFLDEVLAHLNLDSPSVEAVLHQEGVTADDLNAVSGTHTASVGDTLRILGGLVLRGVWAVTLKPFLALGKMVSSSRFRGEVLAAFRRALSHDVRATRHMASVAGRIARGEPVNPYERKEAMHHLVHLLSQAVLVCLTGSQVTGLFRGGVWKALEAVSRPVGEILVILFDRPLRAAGKKLLSQDIGVFGH